MRKKNENDESSMSIKSGGTGSDYASNKQKELLDKLEAERIDKKID